MWKLMLRTLGKDVKDTTKLSSKVNIESDAEDS